MANRRGAATDNRWTEAFIAMASGQCSAGRLFSGAPSARSLRLDAREPDHFGPFLGLVSEELAERGGRARNRDGAEVGDPRLDRRIGETGIDLLVEPVDDGGGRVLWR